MPNRRMRSLAASARCLAIGSVAFALLALGAEPALAGGAFWHGARPGRLDARLVAPEREPRLEQLSLPPALELRSGRVATAARDSVVPLDSAIQFRIKGPLAADGAAGLALEIRF